LLELVSSAPHRQILALTLLDFTLCQAALRCSPLMLSEGARAGARGGGGGGPPPPPPPPRHPAPPPPPSPSPPGLPASIALLAFFVGLFFNDESVYSVDALALFVR